MKEFTITVRMEERWIPHFISMLMYMEQLGGLGGSGEVSFYADGDGDFRPKFKVDIDFEEVSLLKMLMAAGFMMLDKTKKPGTGGKTNGRNVKE